MMLLLVWLFCGGFVGFVAGVALGIDRRLGILVGVVGAAVGGALFSAFGLAGEGLNDAITASSLTGLLLAILTGVVVAGLQVSRRTRVLRDHA